MQKLIVLKGEKLPGESIWVTATEMYNVYDRISLCMDDEPETELIITDITYEGIFVESLQ